jgi:hypothetical protein
MLFASVIAAVVTSYVAVGRHDPQSRVGPEHSEQQASKAAVADTTDLVEDNRLVLVEERLRALERRATDQVAPAQQPKTPAEPASAEEEVAIEARAHQKWISRFEQERPDPAFAPSASRSLRADFDSLATGAKFRTVDVDCRTTMCAATLEWSSYADVRQSTNDIMGHGYDINCAKEIYFPPPDDIQKPYQATVFLDCEQFRANR